jgi:hypothetical protein
VLCGVDLTLASGLGAGLDRSQRRGQVHQAAARSLRIALGGVYLPQTCYRPTTSVDPGVAELGRALGSGNAELPLLALLSGLSGASDSKQVLPGVTLGRPGRHLLFCRWLAGLARRRWMAVGRWCWRCWWWCKAASATSAPCLEHLRRTRAVQFQQELADARHVRAAQPHRVAATVVAGLGSCECSPADHALVATWLALAVLLLWLARRGASALR